MVECLPKDVGVNVLLSTACITSALLVTERPISHTFATTVKTREYVALITIFIKPHMLKSNMKKH